MPERRLRRTSQALVRPADRIRELREGADYEARHPEREEAVEALAHAQRFVDAVAEMLQA
jgi:uncharacterized protein (UPF0332 family)